MRGELGMGLDSTLLSFSDGGGKDKGGRAWRPSVAFTSALFPKRRHRTRPFSPGLRREESTERKLPARRAGTKRQDGRNEKADKVAG